MKSILEFNWRGRFIRVEIHRIYYGRVVVKPFASKSEKAEEDVVKNGG